MRLTVALSLLLFATASEAESVPAVPRSTAPLAAAEIEAIWKQDGAQGVALSERLEASLKSQKKAYGKYLVLAETRPYLKWTIFPTRRFFNVSYFESSKALQTAAQMMLPWNRALAGEATVTRTQIDLLKPKLRELEQVAEAYSKWVDGFEVGSAFRAIEEASGREADETAKKELAAVGAALSRKSLRATLDDVRKLAKLNREIADDLARELGRRGLITENYKHARVKLRAPCELVDIYLKPVRCAETTDAPHYVELEKALKGFELALPEEKRPGYVKRPPPTPPSADELRSSDVEQAMQQWNSGFNAPVVIVKRIRGEHRDAFKLIEAASTKELKRRHYETLSHLRREVESEEVVYSDLVRVIQEMVVWSGNLKEGRNISINEVEQVESLLRSLQVKIEEEHCCRFDKEKCSKAARRWRDYQYELPKLVSELNGTQSATVLSSESFQEYIVSAKELLKEQERVSKSLIDIATRNGLLATNSP